VGTFLARISKGRKLGNFIIASLILPSLWSFVFLGVFGAAQIRISRMAEAAGLDMSSAALTYGHLADKALVGYNQTLKDQSVIWVPVADGVTRLYNLATEDVLFEHICAYGGPGFSTFLTVVMLVCIVLYFVTSSDSASFVVDIMAANGVDEPPLIQKVFWAFTEGAAAAALLASASEENPKAALNAVKALPIILGLPFTFLLFWMCQGLLIVCKEEAGELAIERKQFRTFLLNIEPMSFLSMITPFVPLGMVGSKIWGGSAVLYTVGYGLLWVTMWVLIILTAVDKAFSACGAAMYFIFALSVAPLRISTRTKLGISGGMISDCCACCFALPWAVGQIAAEDLDDVLPKGNGDVLL